MLVEGAHKSLYSLQLSGINCTNCQNKIKVALRERIKSGLIKTSVIILQEKVNVVIQNNQVLQQIIDVLKDIGYKIIGEPTLLQGGGQNIRNIIFRYQINAQSQKLQNILKKTAGIEHVSRVHFQSSIKLRVSYDTRVIKGHEIADIINQKDPNYITINQRVQSFKMNKNDSHQKISIKTTILLCLYFVIFDMVLPFTGEWFKDMSSFPVDLGPYSAFVLLNLAITLYTLNYYAKPIIKRSYDNYFSLGVMDMETLISLGCMSAFFLFCFFMVKYSLDYFAGQFQRDPALMQIIDSLASSSIIVLVVTIGKHFQSKVKGKIEQIANSIFPESKLFEDMTVRHVKLKNRKLKIQQINNYDVSLMEVDDILKVDGGKRLLLDVIVLNGEYQAIKSAIDGNDQTKTFSKGQRIESGSIIVSSSEDALVQVQNVFERSILIEIGTHIKLQRNQQENSKSGIQAVCHSISRYFVKTVILISMLVMASWFFLLSFKFVTVPGCNFCWIVQRGIGVLVASCPCALGLAVPSVVAIVLNIAIKNGILIRNSSVLQKMKKCQIISFDKTGTLFTRINKIEEYHIFKQQIPQNILWQIIAKIQKPIKHPIAQILYKQAYNLSKVEGTNYCVFLNHQPILNKAGLQCQVSLKKTNQIIQVYLGNKDLMKEKGINIPHYVKQTSGATQLYLAIDNQVFMVMVINTHSNLRPQAVRVIQLLMHHKKQVHILSGDSKTSVQQLGQRLHLPPSNLHPQHTSNMKMEWIKKIQNRIDQDNAIGVIMVGDGLNDIPCLQQASIGISINAKSELNINASDVIMLSEDLYKILSFVKLLEKGNKFININLFWAFIYNLTIMPIVAGVFYSFNFTISPVWSSVAMSCSSIIVVSFSHLLSLYQYDQRKKPTKYSKNYKEAAIMSPEDTTKYQVGQKYSKFQQQNMIQ